MEKLDTSKLCYNHINGCRIEVEQGSEVFPNELWPFCSEKCKEEFNTSRLPAIPKDSLAEVKQKAAEAVKYLKKRGFIKLPPGSFFNWVAQDKFDEFKPCLAFKNGAWIPRMDKLAELRILDKKWSSLEWEQALKQSYQKKLINEEMTSLQNDQNIQTN